MSSPTISAVGVGLSLLTLALRWRVPSVPHPVSMAGIVLALCLISMPYTALKTGPAVTLAIGLAIVAAGIQWQLSSRQLITAASPPTDATPADEALPNGHAETTAETLAREQLADLRERRKREAAERARQADEAKRAEKDGLSVKLSQEAVRLVDALRVEYIASHDGISPGMIAGTEPLPDDWVNARLRQMKVAYTYRGNPNGSFTLDPTPDNPVMK